jgi:hypothetical protein
MTQLPVGFVDLVKRHNPHLTELELSRYHMQKLQQTERMLLGLTELLESHRSPACIVEQQY